MGVCVGRKGGGSSPLAGDHTHELVPQLLVLAEHVADLGGGAPDVSGRHVGVGPYVAVQLVHEGLHRSQCRSRVAKLEEHSGILLRGLWCMQRFGWSHCGGRIGGGGGVRS